ncbi:MAG: putative porin [Saprospiraceae bacterium]
MTKSIIKFIFHICLVLITNIMIIDYISAQDIRDEDNKKMPGDTIKEEEEEQTLYLKSAYFTLNNFLDTLAFADTLLKPNFPYFDPVDSCSVPMISTGNIGSATIPITGSENSPGFDPGIHIYDIYKFKPEDFKWQIAKYPFTQLYASPSSTYEDFTVAAKFFRNFQDLNFGIDYSRINNSGDYNNQDTKHTALNLGIWKGNMNSKFNTFINFLVNVHEENQNGGISDLEDLYYAGYPERVSLTTKISDALIRTDNYDFYINEFYKLSDTTSIVGYTPYIKAKIGLNKGFFKFYDNSVTSDSSYYKTLFVDSKGLRNYFEYNSIYSSLGVYGTSHSNNNISIDFNFRHINYNIETLEEEHVNLVELHFKSRNNIKNTIENNLETSLFWGNTGFQYYLNEKLNFKNKFFELTGGIETKSTNPSLLENTLVISQNLIYQNDFKNTQRQSIFAQLSIPKLGSSFEGKIQNIKNLIYFDSTLYPSQFNDNIQLLEGLYKQDLKLFFVHFDNSLYFYKSSSNVIPVPNYILKSKLYFNAVLFEKKLDMNIGFEYNYWDKYYNYGFNPIIANFYIQDQQQLENYQRLDFFIDSKISNFLFYIRFNNVLFPIDDTVYFQAIDYPKYDLFFRFGVKWTLLN